MVTVGGKTFVLNRSASSDDSLYSILAGTDDEDEDENRFRLTRLGGRRTTSRKLEKISA